MSEKFPTYDIAGLTEERVGMHALRTAKRSCSMTAFTVLYTDAPNEVELVISTRIDGGEVTDPGMWDVEVDDRAPLWHDRYIRVDRDNAAKLIAKLQECVDYEIDDALRAKMKAAADE